MQEVGLKFIFFNTGSNRIRCFGLLWVEFKSLHESLTLDVSMDIFVGYTLLSL